MLGCWAMTRPRWDRFWEKVCKSGDCWTWTASVLKADGYGQFGKGERAHRVSWELMHGPIPDGMHVLHTCDNRLCVRPGHLYLGTHQQNMIDVRLRLIGNAKLTPEQVVAVRARYVAGGISQDALAKEVGISDVVLQRILYRKTVS